MRSILFSMVVIWHMHGSEGSTVSCCVGRNKQYVPSSHIRRSPTTCPVTSAETVRSPSPDLNREYYVAPDKVTWRKLTEEELKENNRKVTKTFYLKGTERLEGPKICTRGDIERMDGGGLYIKEGEESPTIGYRQASFSTSMSPSACSRSISTSSSDTDSSDGQDIDRPTLTMCDRLRLSLAGICRGSRWTWTTASTGHIPLALPGVASAKRGPSPVQRQFPPTQTLRRTGSFVDDEQPGLSQRSTVVDTRKRSSSMRTTPVRHSRGDGGQVTKRAKPSPYRHASSSTRMLQS
jgi:hypothetical protein